MARTLVISSILCLLLSAVQTAAAETTAVKAETGPERITLDNGILQVLYNTQTGVFTARQGDRLFITEGRLVETPGSEAPRSKVVELSDALGVGRAIVGDVARRADPAACPVRLDAVSVRQRGRSQRYG